MKIGDRFNPYKEFTGIWTPNWLMERKEISAKAKLVYGRLCQYAGPNGKCYPRRETIARVCGLSIRKVDRAIKELKKEKLIAVERQGFNKPNSYYFLIHPWIIESKKLRQSSSINDLPNMVTLELPSTANKNRII